MRQTLSKATEDRMAIIIKASAHAHGVSALDMKLGGRKRELVDARITASNMICDLMHTEKGVSTTSVGDVLNKSHCTIIYYREQCKNLCSTSKSFKELYEGVEKSVKRILFSEFPDMDTIESLSRTAQL